MYGMVWHLLTNQADPVRVAGVNQKYKNVTHDVVTRMILDDQMHDS